MAKRVKWSTHAVADRIAILDYWFQRIGNKNYSKKLDLSLKEIINMLADYPKLGRQLDNREERFLLKIVIKFSILKLLILLKFFIYGTAEEIHKT